MLQENRLLDRKIFKDSYDKTLVWVVFILVVLGLVMIYSATVGGDANLKGDSWYFLKRQAVFLFISLVICLFLFVSVSMETLKRLTPYIVGVSLFLLVLVLLIGTQVGSTKRWISIFGLFNIQPAELFKLAVVLYLASYLYRKVEVLTQFGKIWFVSIIPGIGAALILVGGDLGSMVIVFAITIGMLFLAGLRISWFVIIIALGLLAGILAILVTPYRVERIMIFINPLTDPYGAGYQTIQSLVANAKGGLWGTGLGNSLSRFYLPEIHTDFISSLMIEELGYIFVLFLCCVYIWIILRAFSIGKKASDLDLFFSSYIAKGIGIWIGVQVFLHVGVNIALLPTKGLTLPLISYGGSSLLITSIAITILLRIDYENRRKTLGFDI